MGNKCIRLLDWKQMYPIAAVSAQPLVYLIQWNAGGLVITG